MALGEDKKRDRSPAAPHFRPLAMNSRSRLNVCNDIICPSPCVLSVSDHSAAYLKCVNHFLLPATPLPAVGKPDLTKVII